MPIDPRTPVIIGVGQSVDRIDAHDYRRWSPPDLAAAAARAAMADSRATGDLAAAIDAIATTRTFEDSMPVPALFGKSSNFPRSVAKRLGIVPRYALWTKVGGNTPQDLVSEFCTRIAAGEFEIALIAGAEAISTVRSASKRGEHLDFSEEPGGDVEDQGMGLEEFIDPITQRNGLTRPTLHYAISENARRARLGQSREDYAAQMGELFAPFAAVAHGNPWSAGAVPPYTPEELVTIEPANRWIAYPYPLRLVARDQVNQGAAIIIASLGAARSLGIPENRLVYLHGCARMTERLLLSRPDLGASPAAHAAARTAIARAGTSVEDIDAFDFYSCFPIAVSNVACDALGIRADDPRGLTVTGGLPFFGGPGNNYAMHAIAEMVARTRTRPGTLGFIGANGGFLSKYSVGIYSSEAREFEAGYADLPEDLPPAPFPNVLETFEGRGTIDSFTVHFDKGIPRYAVVVAHDEQGDRFIARSDESDQATTASLLEADRFGCPIDTVTRNGLNFFTIA